MLYEEKSGRCLVLKIGLHLVVSVSDSDFLFCGLDGDGGALFPI